MERDADEFGGTLDDPGSDFGRRQMALFEHLATVPLASYSLELDGAAYGDLVRPSDRAKYPEADDVSIPYTLERYRLEGYDRRAVFHDMYFTFVERDGTWRIAADDDLEDLGLYTQRTLWDDDPVTIGRSEHFMALAPQCCAPDLDALLGSAERAFAVVERYWSKDWRKRVPLLVPGSTERLSRIIQATYPVENYIAFSYWTGGGGGTAGARIIVNPERFSGDGSARSNEILTHELFHVATLPSSGSFIPNWLDEGFAQYVQFQGDASRIGGFNGSVAATRDAHIPENHEFFIGDATSVYRNYQRSLSLAAFIVHRWDLATLQRFYVQLGRASSPGLADFHFDRTARRVLGISTGELRRAWASSIGVL